MSEDFMILTHRFYLWRRTLAYKEDSSERMLDERVATVTLNIKAVLTSGTLGALFFPHPINSTIEVDYQIYSQTIYCWQLQKAVL